MAKRKTHDEYVAELAVKNPGVTVVGEYLNATTKIDHLCGGCGELWSVAPNTVLTGNSKNCNSCSGKKRKTHAEYLAELAAKRPDMTVVGEYVNNHTKIDHLCGGCGALWAVSPKNAMMNKNCKKCGSSKAADVRRRPHEKYVAELAVKNPSVTVVGKYVNARTKIDHQCRCGEIWSIAPFCLTDRDTKSCPHCAGIVKKTHAQYVAEVNALGKGITVVDEYINNLTRIAHCCSKGHKWDAAPSNILGGRGCPYCAETATDANVFYIWENTQDPGVYKVGITSERCADDRVKQCARDNKMTPAVILMASTPDARDIERRALELGDDPRYPDTIDGYTEFRRYSDAELGEVWRMAVGA